MTSEHLLSLARAFEEEGAGFADRAIPDALNYLSGASEGAAVRQAPSQRLARDGLESWSNSLKRLVAKLMEIARPGSYRSAEAAKRGLADGVENSLCERG